MMAPQVATFGVFFVNEWTTLLFHLISLVLTLPLGRCLFPVINWFSTISKNKKKSRKQHKTSSFFFFKFGAFFLKKKNEWALAAFLLNFRHLMVSYLWNKSVNLSGSLLDFLHQHFDLFVRRQKMKWQRCDRNFFKINCRTSWIWHFDEILMERKKKTLGAFVVPAATAAPL